jgi:hypothetical protein
MFSTFSSLCLLEADKLSNKSRDSKNNGINYTELIHKLLKDKIFAYSSKICVILSHLIYSILCIITLCKVAGTLIIKNFSLLTNTYSGSFTTIINFVKELNSLSSFSYDKQVLILLISFSAFFIYYTMYQTKIARKLFNISIFILTITITIFLIYYSMYLVYIKLSVLDSNPLMVTNRIDLFGADYTYVNINKLLFDSYMEPFCFRLVMSVLSLSGMRMILRVLFYRLVQVTTHKSMF